MKAAKKIIGSTDLISLPEMGISIIPCKIDTGAATSSMHCRKLRVVEKEGQQYVCFRLDHPKLKGLGLDLKKEYRFLKFKEREVRSSNGIANLRYSIKTKVSLFNTTYTVEFTLTDREKMNFPILLGKRFLRNNFLVDVAQDDLNAELIKSQE